MGKLYQSVMLTNELKKQDMIKRLHGLGVARLEDLSYYELKSLLKAIRREGVRSNA